MNTARPLPGTETKYLAQRRKAIKRIRKLGLKNRMPCEPHELMRQINTLCIMMTHARRKKGAKKKRKAILRKMKKLVKRVANVPRNG